MLSCLLIWNVRKINHSSTVHGKSQLYLTDEREGLEVLDETLGEHAGGTAHFAMRELAFGGRVWEVAGALVTVIRAVKV